MPISSALGNKPYWFGSCVGWKRFNLHINNGGKSAKSLGANPKFVDLIKQLDAHFFFWCRWAALKQFGHVYRFKQRFLCQEHRLFRTASNSQTDHAWRAPTGPQSE